MTRNFIKGFVTEALGAGLSKDDAVLLLKQAQSRPRDWWQAKRDKVEEVLDASMPFANKDRAARKHNKAKARLEAYEAREAERADNSAQRADRARSRAQLPRRPSPRQVVDELVNPYTSSDGRNDRSNLRDSGRIRRKLIALNKGVVERDLDDLTTDLTKHDLVSGERPTYQDQFRRFMRSKLSDKDHSDSSEWLARRGAERKAAGGAGSEVREKVRGLIERIRADAGPAAADLRKRFSGLSDSNKIMTVAGLMGVAGIGGHMLASRGRRRKDRERQQYIDQLVNHIRSGNDGRSEGRGGGWRPLNLGYRE
jgi:hypothetical protein